MARDVFGLVGTVLHDKVRVDEAASEGGFAVVYKGHHLGFEQTVAVKCLKLPPHYTDEIRREVLERFREEGKLLFRLSEHPNIVRVFDIGDVPAQGESVPYLVLEWLDGRDLAQVLEDRMDRGAPPYSETEAVRLLRPVVDALSSAHKIGVAHRDLKPENLILARGLDGQKIKVLDFGIAKVMQAGETSASRAVLTTGPFRAFSPAYGAPEQFRRSHGATGPWTDVYALGLILTELVAGQPARSGEEFGDFYDHAMNPEPLTPSALGVAVSTGFEAICAKCMAFDPSDRYQDAGALGRALDEWSEGKGLRPGSVASFASVPSFESDQDTERNLPNESQPELPAGRKLSTTEAATTVAAEKSSISLSGAPSLAVVELPGRALERLESSYGPRSSDGERESGGGDKDNGASAEKAERGSRPAARGRVTTTSSLSTTSSVHPSVEQSDSESKRSRGVFVWAGAGALLTVTVLIGAAVWYGRSSNSKDLTKELAVPGGDFDMGSERGDANQRPVHRVHVDPFVMDATEVTVEDYRRCVKAGACTPADRSHGMSAIPTEQAKWDSLCNWGKEGRDKHPINCVTWLQADSYCRWVGKHLPTEEQWEFAARGGDALRYYPWGQASLSPERLNACDPGCAQVGHRLGWKKWKPLLRSSDGWDTTAPVGSYPKGRGRWGHADLAGNVWEWTDSRYCAYSLHGKGKCQDSRVARGGGWATKIPGMFRGTKRAHYPETYASPLLGFRCAR